MAFTIKNPNTNPSQFIPPRPVAFTFQAKRTTPGNSTLSIVYSTGAAPITLDGQTSVSIQRGIDENETTISHTMTVSGQQGAWIVALAATDEQGTTKNLNFTVLLQ